MARAAESSMWMDSSFTMHGPPRPAYLCFLLQHRMPVQQLLHIYSIYTWLISLLLRDSICSYRGGWEGYFCGLWVRPPSRRILGYKSDVCSLPVGILEELTLSPCLLISDQRVNLQYGVTSKHGPWLNGKYIGVQKQGASLEGSAEPGMRGVFVLCLVDYCHTGNDFSRHLLCRFLSLLYWLNVGWQPANERMSSFIGFMGAVQGIVGALGSRRFVFCRAAAINLFN